MAVITGLLLAAGAGRRAGGPKALRHDHDGTSWLRRSAQVLLDGGCDDVLVVLGAAADEATALLSGLPDVVIMVEPSWTAGMSASLRAGVRRLAASPSRPTACVHLVDLPDVDAAVVRRVLDRDRGPTTLARATYAGLPGHPVLLGHDHLAPFVAGLTGDRGGRDYLAGREVERVECSDLAAGRDVDGAPTRPGATP